MAEKLMAAASSLVRCPARKSTSSEHLKKKKSPAPCMLLVIFVLVN
jgi:hypothetical protein